MKQLMGIGYHDAITQQFALDQQVQAFYGGMAADSVSGSNLDDHLDGNSGNDTLSGLSGNDILNGDAGDDILLGGDGNDTVVGGEHSDHLDGGAGNDAPKSDAQVHCVYAMNHQNSCVMKLTCFAKAAASLRRASNEAELPDVGDMALAKLSGNGRGLDRMRRFDRTTHDALAA